MTLTVTFGLEHLTLSAGLEVCDDVHPYPLLRMLMGNSVCAGSDKEKVSFLLNMFMLFLVCFIIPAQLCIIALYSAYMEECALANMPVLNYTPIVFKKNESTCSTAADDDSEQNGSDHEGQSHFYLSDGDEIEGLIPYTPSDTNTVY